MKAGKADLSAEFDLAADALEGVIMLANAAELEPSRRAKALVAIASTVRLVLNRLRDSARRLDEE